MLVVSVFRFFGVNSWNKDCRNLYLCTLVGKFKEMRLDNLSIEYLSLLSPVTVLFYSTFFSVKTLTNYLFHAIKDFVWLFCVPSTHLKILVSLLLQSKPIDSFALIKKHVEINLGFIQVTLMTPKLSKLITIVGNGGLFCTMFTVRWQSWFKDLNKKSWSMN